MIEAVDRVAQSLRTEILMDRFGLAFDRVDDGRVMQHRDAALCPQSPQLVLELARLIHRLVDEQLGYGFAERRELAAAVAAHEALDAGKADAVDLVRLVVEQGHARAMQD